MLGLKPGWSRSTPLWVQVVAAFCGPAAITLLALPGDHPPTAVVAVLYVLAVVVVARIGGAAAGLVASALSFLALNFFFTEPLHTLEVGAPEDLVALFVFLAASVVVGLLLSSALEAKARAERRELETRLMNRLSTGLLSGGAPEELLSEFAEGICDIFELGACEITTPFSTASTNDGSDADEPDETFPLTAKGRDLGEIKLWLGSRRELDGDERSVVRSIAGQLAVALEGVRLSIEIRRAEIDAHSSQLKAALFSGVTHDVKTPLAAITASVTSLIDGESFNAPARRAHLETIRHEADRLNRVVNNLLDLARLRAGALIAIKTPSPIDELMESVLNRLRPLLGDRSVEIRVGDDVPEVPMDVVQIDQVLTNLIENAIKFSPAGTPIGLVAVGNETNVRITVSDQGPGIPREDRTKIFEPFERGDTRTSGTGLGLAICNAIVLAHGGRMWVSDGLRGGAAFTFELPCSRGAASSEEVTDGRAGARR